jgi:hypothetical protein
MQACKHANQWCGSVRSRIVTALFAASALSCPSAHAGVILGGSALLDSTDLTKLEGWLGEGELTLTNVFTKTIGDDGVDFHAAADGKGRTFVVLSAQESIATGSKRTAFVERGFA